MGEVINYGTNIREKEFAYNAFIQIKSRFFPFIEII